MTRVITEKNQSCHEPSKDNEAFYDESNTLCHSQLSTVVTQPKLPAALPMFLLTNNSYVLGYN